eukprot:1015905-Pleurochrysis_carterae.AAC.1
MGPRRLVKARKQGCSAEVSTPASQHGGECTEARISPALFRGRRPEHAHSKLKYFKSRQYIMKSGTGTRTFGGNLAPCSGFFAVMRFSCKKERFLRHCRRAGRNQSGFCCISSGTTDLKGRTRWGSLR